MITLDDLATTLTDLTATSIADVAQGVAFAEIGGRDGAYTPSTLFGAPCLLGCSFDEELLKNVGRAVADECVSDGIGVVLAADVNIATSPTDDNARAYSEDPIVCGRAGGAFCKGLSAGGVKTALRNFVFTGVKSNKYAAETVDERSLMELYGLPYEIAIAQGDPDIVTLAPYSLNGELMSQNARMISLLKNEYGFDKILATEAYGVEDWAKAIKAGVSIGLSPDEDMATDIEKGLKDKFLTESDVERTLRSAKAVAKPTEIKTCDVDGHHEIAVKAVRESLVLLKNNGVLPLKTARLTIFDEPCEQRGNVEAYVKTTTSDVFGEAFEKVTRLRNVKDKDLLSAASDSDVLLIWVCDDRSSRRRYEEIAKVVDTFKTLDKKVVAVLNCASYVDFPFDKADAVIYGGLWGQGGLTALVEILKGDHSPCGKLATTIYKTVDRVEQATKQSRYSGYRLLDKRKDLSEDVAFAFGEGLGYSTIVYGDLKLSTNVFRQGDKVKLAIDVANLGEYDVKEVVQMYVCPPSKIVDSVKELKNYVKIDLPIGQKKTVYFDITDRELAYYDSNVDTWRLETGIYKIFIGASNNPIKDRQLQVFALDERTPYVDEPRPSIAEDSSISTFGELKARAPVLYYKLLAMEPKLRKIDRKTLSTLPLRALRSIRRGLFKDVLYRLKNKLT